MDDQVLLEPAGADAGLELGVFGRRRRRLADVGRGENELVERDVADGGRGWSWRETPATGGRSLLSSF